ncbi:Rf1 [Symbiodinium natans]|uniref:Rf1 protein n=1 Tax=Symbiodinium natans TaxID=878477 RepID=A0A812MI81_9DINO|nr:Rf1 [Symbiodinium natans]
MEAQLRQGTRKVNSAASAHVRQACWAEALSCISAWERQGGRRDLASFHVAAGAFGASERWEGALSCLDGLRRRFVEANQVSANTALKASSLSCWPSCLAVVMGMRQRGLAADEITCSTAINGCSKESRWRPALGALDALQRRTTGLRPNLVCFNAALAACERREQWAAAMDLAGNMPCRDLRLDGISANSRLSALAKSSQWRRTIAAFSAFAARGRDVVSFGVSLLAYQRGQCWRSALCHAGQICSAGLRPNLLTITSALRSAAGWRQALTIFGGLARLSLRSSLLACTGLVASCAQTLGWQLAVAAQQGLRRVGTNIDGIFACSLLETLEEANRWRLGVALAAHLSKEVRSNEFIHTALVSARGKVGHWRPALALREAWFAKEAQPKVALENAALSACAAAGGLGWQRAGELLAGAVALGVEATSVSFGALADAYAKGGAWTNALQWLRQFAARSLRPESIAGCATLHGLEKCSQWLHSLQLLHFLRESHECDQSAYDSAVVACEKGEPGSWL